MHEGATTRVHDGTINFRRSTSSEQLRSLNCPGLLRQVRGQYVVQYLTWPWQPYRNRTTNPTCRYCPQQDRLAPGLTRSPRASPQSLKSFAPLPHLLILRISPSRPFSIVTFFLRPPRRPPWHALLYEPARPLLALCPSTNSRCRPALAGSTPTMANKSPVTSHAHPRSGTAWTAVSVLTTTMRRRSSEYIGLCSPSLPKSHCSPAARRKLDMRIIPGPCTELPTCLISAHGQPQLSGFYTFSAPPFVPTLASLRP